MKLCNLNTNVLKTNLFLPLYTTEHLALQCTVSKCFVLHNVTVFQNINLHKYLLTHEKHFERMKMKVEKNCFLE